MLEDNEVESFLNAFLEKGDDLSRYGVTGDYFDSGYDEPIDHLRFGMVGFVIDGVELFMEAEEGGDGDGSLITLILGVERNGKNVAFIRLYAYHSSYDSTEWDFDEAELVEPRQVMVTQYFALDGSDDE